MVIAIIFTAAIFFCLGVVTTLILSSGKKYDGRLIVGRNEYYVAITASPEELEQKENIVLKIFKE